MPRLSFRLPGFFSRTERQPLPVTVGPAEDRRARLVVAGVWAAMFVLLLVFVARSAPRVPFLDEYCNVHLLADPFGVPVARYWEQHNEHRIPLPRVLYIAAFRLAGNDFRGPPVLNALLLAAAAAVLGRAVAQARGRYAYTDAVIPLLVMTVGQWDNLVWGFQVQFVSSTVLVLLILAAVIDPRFATSFARVATAGLLTLLLPLCGANGVAFCPALASFLLFVGVRNLWSGGRSQPVVGVAAGGFGLLASGMILLYFHGYQPATHHETSRSWGAVAVNVVNFLGVGFGWLAAAAHGPDTPGIAAFGAGMLVILLGTAGLLIARARTPDRRVTAVAIACVIGGTLCLGLGLAYGRAAMGGILVSNRYTTLAMPLAVAVYAAWAILPGPRVGRAVPVLFLVVAVAGLWTNIASAFTIGGTQKANQGRVEFEIRSGIPVTFVVDRHHPPEHRAFYVWNYQALQKLGTVPFRDLVADPPMDEVEVPVRVIRSEGMELADGYYRVTGEKGYLVLALPRKEYVYGLKLAYEAERPHGESFLCLVGWEPGGTYPPRPGYGIIDQLRPTTGRADAHIFVDRETDTLRIDLGHAGSAVRVHGLSVLTRRP